MNNREEFEKWYKSVDFVAPLSDAWQAACSLKDEEIDQWTVDYNEARLEILELQDTIERLNAQVAPLIGACVIALRYLNNSNHHTCSSLSEALHSTSSDWLTTHDAKVKNIVREEIAEFISRNLYDNKQYADEIRAMKGPK
jgi:hypothetical protein